MDSLIHIELQFAFFTQESTRASLLPCQYTQTYLIPFNAWGIHIMYVTIFKLLQIDEVF